MSGSDRENNEFIKNFVEENVIRKVLDVGTGRGTYSDILKPFVDSIDGIEIWEPYVEQFGLENKYNTLIVGDARQVMKSTHDIYGTKPLGYKYDLVIFGDVLEHMSEADSLTMWDNASRIATWGMMSVPIIYCPQGVEEGNPYEIHVQDHLLPSEIIETYGPFDCVETYVTTGTFIRRF